MAVAIQCASILSIKNFDSTWHQACDDAYCVSHSLYPSFAYCLDSPSQFASWLHNVPLLSCPVMSYGTIRWFYCQCSVLEWQKVQHGVQMGISSRARQQVGPWGDVRGSIWHRLLLQSLDHRFKPAGKIIECSISAGMLHVLTRTDTHIDTASTENGHQRDCSAQVCLRTQIGVGHGYTLVHSMQDVINN